MPRRKWRFEALEDRRLLASLAGSPVPAVAAASNAGETAADAPGSSGTAYASSKASPSEASENYAEYASGAPTQASDTGYATPSNAAAYATSSYASPYYASPARDYGSTTEYASSYIAAPKATASSPSAAQPSANNLLSQPAASTAVGSSADSQALLPPATSSGPATVAVPPVARSTNEVIGWRDEAAVASGEQVGPTSIAEQKRLVAPVALASVPSDWNRLAARTAALEELLAPAGKTVPLADVVVRQPLAEPASVSSSALEQGIDEVLERLGLLRDGFAESGGATRVAQWLVIAGGACAAFEYARARYREGGPWQAANTWPIPYEPRLRRRWIRSARGNASQIAKYKSQNAKWR